MADREGVMFAADRIILPTTMRSEMLQRLHVAHQGIQQTKALARKHWYWPGMTRDIEQMVGCVEHASSSSPATRRSP